MTFEELTDALHLRLGILTRVTAQLDLSIGLAVNELGHSNGLDISNLLDPSRARLTLRLNMLKKLVDITYHQRTQQKTKEFTNWLARANSLPALKNHYIHAEWSVHSLADEGEPAVFFKIPSWNNLPDKLDSGTKLKLSEFDEQIDALKKLNLDLGLICSLCTRLE